MVGRQITKSSYRTTIALLCVALTAKLATADEYDPPANYYSTAVGNGSVLKSALHNIIDGHTTRSYDQLRVDLQVVDAVPGDPTKIYVVYNNRVPVTKPTGGSIPGWDNGVTWNREHSWPQARGVDGTGAPDGTDMFHVIPAKESDNSTRGNLNFGGQFGQQPRGQVNDGGTKYYPGDLDAGFIARAQFYMAVRYDGGDSGTQNLELVTGNPGIGGTTMSDINRLIEWHFATPPDTFERRRNEIIYDNYQHNRNPFIDRPEFAWSVFVDQFNDSRITIDGGTTGTFNASTRTVDLGRVFTGSPVPAAQTFSLNKAGNDGTYFAVTAAGDATSSLTGRYNAFRTSQTDSKPITVGLNTSTATAGFRTGTVTVDNLDVTEFSSANDFNDIFHVQLAVVDHAMPSFSHDSLVTTQLIDFGTVPMNTALGHFFSVYNWESTPGFTATMEFDALLSSGDIDAFSMQTPNVGTSIPGSQWGQFAAHFNTDAVGTYSASYTLRFSDEDLPGAETNKDVTITLTGTVILPGDFNRDGLVDAADYVVWRKANGMSTAPFSGADADGSGVVDAIDLGWWEQNFGMVAEEVGGGASSVPEPSLGVILVAFALVLYGMARTRACIN
jgi:endonuclease I